MPCRPCAAPVPSRRVSGSWEPVLRRRVQDRRWRASPAVPARLRRGGAPYGRGVPAPRCPAGRPSHRRRPRRGVLAAEPPAGDGVPAGPPRAAPRGPPRSSTAAASPPSCSRLPLTTHGCIVYARSPAGDGVRPSRCSREAAPSATAEGSSIRRMPDSSSTSSCSSQPSQPTANSPSTFSSAAYSRALPGPPRGRTARWAGSRRRPAAAVTRSSGSGRCPCRRRGPRGARRSRSGRGGRGGRAAPRRSISSRSPTPVASAVAAARRPRTGDVVVGQGPVDHGGGAQDDPVHPRAAAAVSTVWVPRTLYAVRAAAWTPGPGRGPGAPPRRRRAALGDRRVRTSRTCHCASSHLPAALVDGDDLLDLSDAASRPVSSAPTPEAAPVTATTGPRAAGRLAVSRCANVWIWGTHRASPAVVFSTDARDAYVPGDVHPAAAPRSAEHRARKRLGCLRWVVLSGIAAGRGPVAQRAEEPRE